MFKVYAKLRLDIPYHTVQDKRLSESLASGKLKWFIF